MVTKERFAKGLTLEQYLDQMSMNRDRFDRAFDGVTVQPTDEAMLRRLGPVRHALVITEDWCGTALSSVPVLARLVAGRPEIEVRVFLRDANLDLMDQYLNRGIFKSIPVFVFFDRDMKEVARFIERPPKITEYMEQKQLELRRQLRAQHGAEWQRSAAEEIRALLG